MLSQVLPAGAGERADLAILARGDAPLADVMAALTRLDRSPAPWHSHRVGIAANISVDLLATALRRHAYLEGVRLTVAKGSYNDLQGDLTAHQAAGVDAVLVLPFFDNLQPAWEARLGHLDPGARDAVQSDWLQRLDLALQAAEGLPQVLVFSAHLLDPQVAADSPQHRALAAFNDGLARLVATRPSVRLIDTTGPLASHGAQHAFDARFYFRARAPYSAGFVDRLAREVAAATRGFGSRFHKVLVLDCDGTLWGGIVGEDGLAGLALDPHAYPGNVYWTVQQQLRALQAQGVLLCLCSKNNPEDVAEAFGRHPAMVLGDAHIVARRINWLPKPDNLRSLAAELQLGIDSMVFLDDSAFEVEAVREQLPQVAAFQVPAALQHYPALLREQIAPLFLAGGVTAESRAKTAQYRALAQAAQLRSGFASHEDYLRSLGLQLRVQRRPQAQLARVSELMAKSNQFNLTTERPAAGALAAWMSDPGMQIYALSVCDRLIDHGLTGVLITVDEGDAVRVHSFLMSCRVLGRGVEFAVWPVVVADALVRGRRRLQALFRPTDRNAQVADFYDRLGLDRRQVEADGSIVYEAELAGLRLTDNDWVEVIDAGPE